MSRFLILALMLSLLTESAFGNIEQLMRSIASAFQPSNVGIDTNVPRSGFGIRTPNSEFSIGYDNVFGR
ncbi:uncharacterized protein Sfp60F [Drosophila takahashii]|uniref:uncharacterized protein Sfp60F n=1 Tax=Drosophila takahashii TaxID=29030 RepID=UPI0007E871D7|nr:uncharacterized protein LOC108066379 [Drosophila takahashii]